MKTEWRARPWGEETTDWCVDRYDDGRWAGAILSAPNRPLFDHSDPNNHRFSQEEAIEYAAQLTRQESVGRDELSAFFIVLSYMDDHFHEVTTSFCVEATDDFEAVQKIKHTIAAERPGEMFRSKSVECHRIERMLLREQG